MDSFSLGMATDFEPSSMPEQDEFEPDIGAQEEPDFDLGKAAREIGISVPTIKRWIYKGIIKSEKNRYNHHRIKQSEINRVRKKAKKPLGKRILKLLDTQRVAYQRQIQVLLETKYSHQETSTELGKLVGLGKLKTLEVENSSHFPHKWYYRPTLGSSDASALVQEKMEVLKRYYPLINNNKFTDPDDNREGYDDYSEYLVEKCFEMAGYVVIKRNTYRFRGKILQSHMGQGDSKDLDFIVMKPTGQVFIGVQVKNRLEPPSSADVQQLIDLCDGLGLKPLLISRVCEPRFFPKIKTKGGRIIVFKRQFLHPGVPRELFDQLNGMGIPVGVYKRPPEYLVKLLIRNRMWFK